MYPYFDTKEEEDRYYQGREEACNLQEKRVNEERLEGEVGCQGVGKMEIVRLGAGCPAVGKIEMLVEDIVARGGFTLLAAEEGAGKTAWLMRLAEAVITGQPFMKQLHTIRGRVLMIQADEPLQDSEAKLRLMELPAALLEIMFVDKFDLPRIFEVISTKVYDLVILDSFTYGLTDDRVRVTDDAFTDRLYKLRKWFSEYNVAGIGTTHLNKPFNGQARQTITKHDIAGLSTIRNATSDIWGLLPSPSGEDEFKMVCLGKRYCPKGTEWTIQGSSEDLSFELIDTSVQILPQEKKKLMQKIMDHIAWDDTAKHPRDIATTVGSSYESVRRICSMLYAKGDLARCKADASGKGRPEYMYLIP